MKMRKAMALALVMLLLVSLAGCGGSASQDSAVEYAIENEAPASKEMLTGQSASGQVAAENRKLIKTVYLEAETEDLDTLLTGVEQRIEELGGYVESREIYNGSSYSDRRYRRADLTVRIPAENVDGFVADVSGISNVVSSNEQIEDVTLQYVDTESRVKALETERDRLLELLAQAQSMSDLLEIEARLTEVRYELESVTSQLRALENQVSYATVHLYVSEVQEYTPVEEETVWQRIGGGFLDSLEEIADGFVEVFVWVLANSPYLVLWGTVLGIVCIAGRKLRRRRKPVNRAAGEDRAE